MATREAILSVEIRDSNGKPTPARVRLVDSQSRPPKSVGGKIAPDSPFGIPSEAIAVQYGRNDAAEGYLLQPDGSFYIDGSFRLTVPPGKYSITITKGPEYLQWNETVEAGAGRKVAKTARLQRWIDMPARGWYSADDHIHVRRSPRENPQLVRWVAAEDLHVGNLLQMGDFWTTYFAQYAFGKEGRYQEGGHLLSPGQEEPRTPEIGHTISLGAEQLVRFQPDYYSYDRLFDRVHQLGGVSGFAHQAVSFHGYRGMALNVLRGKVDFLELVQFCVSGEGIVTDHYYRFLDLGYKLTALAGSDFPWCGKGASRIGDVRFYTLVGKQFDFGAWMAAVKAGRTFATSGPMVEFTVNGEPPGSEVRVAKGSRLRVKAKAWGQPGQVPLRELEIVGHGEVLRKQSGTDAKELEIDFELPVERGIWIAAKASGGKSVTAHTTPVYVSVDGGGWSNPKTFAQRIAECEASLAEVEKDLENTQRRMDEMAQRHRQSLGRQLAEARAVLAKRKASGE
ncbi:MAG: CehA/McbA family metallohydrolase [Acidobacteria bacterium]|nr:CehA/McbA family metallohydrolase [Acidobacteriota bacterium]